MTKLAKPFFKAQIQYFDTHQLDEAWTWLKEKT
jgi:hypothetical protein